MLTSNLKNKLNELFFATPENIGVMYGKKKKNNLSTNEDSIVFLVEKKIPINQLKNDEVLPTEIEIGGINYVTDVLEVGETNLLICDNEVLNSCYDWQTTAPINQQTVRPLQGGLSIQALDVRATGTLGFLANDSLTGGIVGVTNSHVLIKDYSFTGERNLLGLIENTDFDIADWVYQTGEGYPFPQNVIGKAFRYIPYKLPPEVNYVDAALSTINLGKVQAGPYVDPMTPRSWMQYGLSGITEPMPFATTSEIDNLISNPPSEVWSNGRTTGPKQGICGLKIAGLGASITIVGRVQNIPRNVIYSDLISVTRINPDCPTPVYFGDSGSALIAIIGGKPKIIGLIFAGSSVNEGGIGYSILGYACRIDRIAEELSIEAWDGLQTNFIRPVFEYVTISGGSLNNTHICSGETYWQVGLTNRTRSCAICDEISFTITITAPITQFTLTLGGFSTFGYVIDFGNGSIFTQNNNLNYIVGSSYTQPGVYNVRIGFTNCGLISIFKLSGNSNRINISSIQNLESLINLSSLTINLTNLNNLDNSIPNSPNLNTIDFSNNLLTSFILTQNLITNLNNINLYNNNLNTFEVNTTLDNLSNINWTYSPPRLLDIRQNPAAPPSVGPPNGIQAKINLQLAGWTVNTD